MGDSTFIKKFQRLLAECEKDHVNQGKIDEFIKVDTESKAKGMVVTDSEGSHRVEFASCQKKYITDSSRFRIDDEIIVLGKKNHSQPTTTLPSIILIPEEEEVILSQENLGLKFHGIVDYVHVLFYLLSSIFGFLFLFRDFFYVMLAESLYLFQLLVDWSGYGLILTFLAYILLNSYIRNKYRERYILCDPETWNIISEEIVERFGVSIELAL
jgi:hypothetical protein